MFKFFILKFLQLLNIDYDDLYLYSFLYILMPFYFLLVAQKKTASIVNSF